MKLLILGGTVFLGRHLTEAASASGHEVTLFNRGQHSPDLFPEVEKLRGDREYDLTALLNGRWDAVVDTSGFVPRVVQASADLLADSLEHYTFVSSISVYSNISGTSGADESHEIGILEDETEEEITGETYGPLKALCERAAEDPMPGRVLNVRPGLIVGPHDTSDRFTYWPHRVAQGGEVLVPGKPERAVQLIDARDLAGWILRMAEDRKVGVYNATGPAYPLTMGEVIEACVTASGSDAEIIWVDEDFLLERGVTPWSELPFWLPEDRSGMLSVNVGKAIADGLKFRPIGDTVRDTLAWDAVRDSTVPLEAGMEPEREAELLREWRR